MPATQRAATARRPILRFDLASISIDDRPNMYKNPQLVLKPQLELAHRRPYTGSRPRTPLWRHFLMVHVKDKADELVKLDLAVFKPPPAGGGPVSRHSVSCLFPMCSLVFLYSKGTENGSSTLRVRLQKPTDLETVLRELGELSINIEYQWGIREHHSTPGIVAGVSWAPSGLNVEPVYQPSSNTQQLNNSSPQLATIPSLQDRYSVYPESHPRAALIHRPPSQPIGRSVGLQPGQRPWSPAFVPSRPATALGVPGILDEGIYKVSKIGSATSGRPRLRRTSTILEQHGPGLYTVSKHFDKTLSRADTLPTTRGHHLGRKLSSSLQAIHSSSYLTRPPSLGVGGTESQHTIVHKDQATQPRIRNSSALESISGNTQQQPMLGRLGTMDSASDPRSAVGFDNTRQSSLSSVAEESVGFVFSQPTLASSAGVSVDDAFLFSSSPTLLEPRPKQEMTDDWMLQVSQVQHRGLCEASRVWDEFMQRAGTEVVSEESAENLPQVLAKYESEFTRRWEEVVADTVQKMRAVGVGSYAI